MRKNARNASGADQQPNQKIFGETFKKASHKIPVCLGILTELLLPQRREAREGFLTAENAEIAEKRFIFIEKTSKNSVLNV
ncbi:MAG: hypothetical protein KC445_22145 [Anaerolineales bacterium]|nr:hypothetical protein [Anaerolineales bacterium]